MKIAAYIRVSTVDKGQNTDNQLIEIKAFCEKHGHDIVKIYEDHMSGAKDNRKGFLDMFEDAKKKQFDAVVVYSCDRFSRSGAIKTFELIADLKKSKVDFISVKEEFINTSGAFAPVMLALMAVMAEMERAKISNRVKSGMQRCISEGRKFGKKQEIDIPKVLELKQKGLSNRAIGRELGRACGSINYIINKQNENKNI